MVTIDRFTEILDGLAEELPTAFFDELNGGIIVDPGRKLHPEARQGDLYVMGEYCTVLRFLPPGTRRFGRACAQRGDARRAAA